MPPTDPTPLFDASVSPMDHEQAMTYLPWLAQGDLEPDIRRRLLAHLDQCADCRRELLYISELRAALDVSAIEMSPTSATPPLDIESSLASVMQRIDRAHPTAGATETAISSHTIPSVRPPQPQPFGLAMAAGLVLALLVGFMLRPLLLDPVPSNPVPRNPVPGTYTTLSDAPKESHAATTSHATTTGKQPAGLSVGFQPDTSITRIQAILRSIDGQIVGGPSALGILSVSLQMTESLGSSTDSATTDEALHQALSTLRAQPETTFAEPVFPKPGSSATP